MLQSNMPYQRVDDGVGAGFIGGALAGGAVAGTAGFQVNRANAFFKDRKNNLKDKHFEMKTMGASDYELSKVSKAITNNSKMRGSINNLHKTTHGSGKRKAISIAGSVLAGGILGATIDAANN